MSKAKTKDEKFLVALYNAAKETQELDTPFDKYAIGQKIGLHPKGVNTICVLLLQANFIKKSDGDTVYITPHGEKLVLTILEE